MSSLLYESEIGSDWIKYDDVTAPNGKRTLTLTTTDYSKSRNIFNPLHFQNGVKLTFF